MLRTFKTQIYPTAEQQEYIRKACGIRRWTWNWAVAKYFEEAAKDKFLNNFQLQKILNNGPVKDGDHDWLSEVNSMVRAEALKDFTIAIQAYVKARKRSKRTVDKIDVDKFKPHFKKKGKCTESFRLSKKNDSVFKVHSAHDFSVTTTNRKPRMHIRPHESLEFLKTADIKTCTFSMKGDRFFMSLTYEKANLGARKHGTGKVGLDLGIKHPVTAWNGNEATVFDLPVNLDKAEKKTERCNTRLQRTVKGSRRHEKILQQIQRAYMHEANIKKDWREKLTTQLVESYDQINLDDFNFIGAKNLNCNRALYRVGAYAFKTRLEEKATERGVQLNIVEEFTPTTQTCSSCGAKHKVTLKERTYKCASCGLEIDRDVNAAINTYNYC